jgi:hypothetical protein
MQIAARLRRITAIRRVKRLSLHKTLTRNTMAHSVLVGILVTLKRNLSIRQGDTVAVTRRIPLSAYAILSVRMPRSAVSGTKRSKNGRGGDGPRRRKPASSAAVVRPGLLIIECDANKLAADGLAVGETLSALMRRLHPRIPIELIRTSILAELQRSLGDVGNIHGRFRLVLLIGHSNETGIQWTSDTFLAWNEVGSWLQYFEPDSVFLTACKGGRLSVVQKLFGAMPKLKRVYGSPTALSINQNHPVVICTLDELGRRGLTSDVRRIVQTASFLLTKGVVFRWTRKDATASGEALLKSVGIDLAARLWEKVSKGAR